MLAKQQLINRDFLIRDLCFLVTWDTRLKVGEKAAFDRPKGCKCCFDGGINATNAVLTLKLKFAVSGLSIENV